MWSKTAVWRVLFDTSGNFSRSAVPRYVSLLPAHVPRIDDAERNSQSLRLEFIINDSEPLRSQKNVFQSTKDARPGPTPAPPRAANNTPTPITSCDYRHDLLVRFFAHHDRPTDTRDRPRRVARRGRRCHP
jgi:hypothetical protein